MTIRMSENNKMEKDVKTLKQNAARNRVNIRMLCITFSCMWLVFFLIVVAMTIGVRRDYESQMAVLQEEIDCLTRQLSERDSLLDEASGIFSAIADGYVEDTDFLMEDIDAYLQEYEELLFDDGYEDIEDEYVEDDEYDEYDEYDESDGVFREYPYGGDDVIRVMKPMIYVYPEQTTDVTVNLGEPEKLTCTYPFYNDGWNVTVEPDGTMHYDDRDYYGLYWEGDGSVVSAIEKGFCVKGADSAVFLEYALKELGLNDIEANEFIVYWLPKLEANPYNIIYFATYDEQDEYMPLDVIPAPDTMIRVNMVWKPSKYFVDIPAQILNKVERNGYTVVEWGGTELK